MGLVVVGRLILLSGAVARFEASEALLVSTGIRTTSPPTWIVPAEYWMVNRHAVLLGKRAAEVMESDVLGLAP